VLGGGGPAYGTVIDDAALTAGQQSVAAGLFTVTAGLPGDVFDRKTALGVSASGLSGGGSIVTGEIDSVEAITVHAAAPQRLDGFTVAFLFAAGTWGDAANEMALVDVVSGSSIVATLGLTANQSGGADLSGAPGGIVTTISPGTGNGAGEFSVSGLGIGFTDLVFRPGNGGGLAPAGDFAFVNLVAGDMVAVPEPGSLSILGAACLGFPLIGRRRLRRGGTSGQAGISSRFPPPVR
jgi:hypothetical protein